MDKESMDSLQRLLDEYKPKPDLVPNLFGAANDVVTRSFYGGYNSAWDEVRRRLGFDDEGE